MSKLASRIAHFLSMQFMGVTTEAAPRRKGERIRGLQPCGPVPRGRIRIGRNDPCPCGKRNAKSLEWRIVDGELKQVPRPMKFKDCCHTAAREARYYKPSRSPEIISQRMRSTLDQTAAN